MAPTSPATAYQSQAVHTANGPVLLVMLYDRLAVDIDRGGTAIEARDYAGANIHLQHAQRIVRLLRNSLDSNGFAGGKDLYSLYNFLEKHLIEANMAKDTAKVRECANLVAPLHRAWRKAVADRGGVGALADLG